MRVFIFLDILFFTQALPFVVLLKREAFVGMVMNLSTIRNMDPNGYALKA